MRSSVLLCFLFAFLYVPFALCQSSSSSPLSSSNKTTPSNKTLTYTQGLVKVLQANNLSWIGNLLDQYGANVTALLQAPGNKTFLVPTDAAKASLGNTSVVSGPGLVQLLAYHILNGTVRRQDVPRHGYKVQIASTMYNMSSYVDMPTHAAAQVVVLASKSVNNDTAGAEYDHNHVTGENDRIFVRETDRNISFALPTTDGPTYENVLIQPIEQILSFPGDVTFVSQQLHFEEVSVFLDVTGLLDPVKTSRSLTIFAPTPAAVTAGTLDVTKLGPDQQVNTLLNHIVNGTVVYSTDLPADDESDSPRAIRSVVTASGQTLTFSNVNGQLTVQSGTIRANVIRSDVLLSNGVAHLIDKLLINPSRDQKAADDFYKSAMTYTNLSGYMPGSPFWGYGNRDQSLVSVSNGVKRSTVTFSHTLPALVCTIALFFVLL